MAIKVQREHRCSDLSAHGGMLLNRNLGFNSQACILDDAWKRKAARWTPPVARKEKPRRALRVAGASAGIVGTAALIIVALL